VLSLNDLTYVVIFRRHLTIWLCGHLQVLPLNDLDCGYFRVPSLNDLCCHL